MHIAFQAHPGESWKAGLTSIVSIVQGLRALGDPALELSLVMWEGTRPENYRTLLPHLERTVTAPAAPPQAAAPHLASLRHHLLYWARRRLLGQLPAPNHAFTSVALQRAGVDCTFSLPLEQRTDFGVPLIVWIPDLQHHHLPELISPAEAIARDSYYRREAQAATLVLVTAATVRDDLARFAPDLAGKVRVLPFVAPLPKGLYNQDPAALAAAYHLPERFIWLPNQFWRHKNHQRVLDALQRLRGRSIYPVVACAGNHQDHRNPFYFSELLRQVAQGGLREQFLFVGMVPHEENLLLMRQALCVLNPSLFEGFGFSVAESRAVGKRMLLSDLPAHREQDAPDAEYFDPQDVAALADKLAQVWQTAQPGPDLEREAAARAEFPARQRQFGQGFLNLAREAVALAKGA